MDTKLELNIHSFLPLTYANGPGARACLWVQGCSLACPGCFNPETHDSSGERFVVTELANRILGLKAIEGITVSGGEPLQQSGALVQLLTTLRENSALSIIVFTGYSYEQAIGQIDLRTMSSLVDVLIAGPYIASGKNQRVLGSSEHKTVHLFSNRYKKEDLDMAPSSELILSADGAVTVTGVDPFRMRLA